MNPVGKPTSSRFRRLKLPPLPQPCPKDRAPPQKGVGPTGPPLAGIRAQNITLPTFRSRLFPIPVSSTEISPQPSGGRGGGGEKDDDEKAWEALITKNTHAWSSLQDDTALSIMTKGLRLEFHTERVFQRSPLLFSRGVIKLALLGNTKASGANSSRFWICTTFLKET